MKTFRERKLLAGTLCLCVGLGALSPAAFSQKKKAPTEAVPPPVNEEFKFGKVDLELLDQVDLLDRRFERDGLVLEGEATNAYLERIGNSLVPKGLTLDHVKWKFRALRDSQPNAFALPNGSIYVTTGLMSLLENESQLASVLAHELTHVMRRHTYLQNRSNRKKYLTANVIQLVGGLIPGDAAAAAMMLVAVISPLIVQAMIAGYSRDLEREADLKGIDMMISAEYPPEEMVKVMKLLNKDIEGEEIRLFYNDHPALQERINYLSSYLGGRADKITPQMELNREMAAYFRNMEPVMRHDIQLSINAGRFRSAVYLAQHLVDFHADSENLFWLAEAYRTLGPRSPQLTERESTNNAKKEAAKKREKRTIEEEEHELLATPAGQENAKAHQQKAEELYLRALGVNEPAPMAHRGLGMLYEKSGRTNDAISEYEKYAALAPAALDHERIQKRIEALRRLPQ